MLLEKISKNFTHTRLDTPPKKLHKYPHLIYSDAEIWDRFLTKYPDFFDAVMYDVHVGEGQYPETETDPAIIKMAIELTQRRIDVLAERNGNLWIVELKFDPGVSLVGQLIAYKTLMQLQDKTLTNPVLCAIVNRIDPDLQNILKVQNIVLFVV